MTISFVLFSGLATAVEKENINLGVKKFENKLEIKGKFQHLSFTQVFNAECE